MKFTTFTAIIASAMNIAIASADLHNFCACGTRTKGDAVMGPYWTFFEDETITACNRYLARNTGDEEWDQCADCRMDVQRMDGDADIPSCFSPGYHMGGDEFDYYCGLLGRQGYCKSVGSSQG